MVTPKFIVVLLSAGLLIHYATSAKQPVASQKSKLCSNVACEEVLFKSRVKRVMGVNNDPNFLNLAENSIISVVAVKFSDRPDIMEGKLSDDGPTGFFYAGAIDLLPFAEFLRTAIDEKKEMLMISQNPADTGDKRIVGYVHSETDLVRDYNAKNAQAAAEHGLPAPTPLPIPEPAGGHGHSHGGHGHSHGGHGHSHGGHGHSHGHPAPTPTPVQQEPVVTPAPEIEPPKVDETPKEEIKEDVKQELNLNSVLGAPPTIPPVEQLDIQDLDAEIDKLIRAEEEQMLANKLRNPGSAANEVKVETPEEVTQPPLVLSSLPAEPVTPSPVETAPEAVPVVPVVPVVEEPVTTTPLPQVVADPVEVVTPVPVELPPLVQENVVPTTTPAPIAQEPIAQYIPPPPQEVVPPPPVAPEEPATTTAPPTPVVSEEPAATVTPPPPVPVEEESTGVCYKDECDGLQTPAPPPVVENKSQEEEDFLKWEEERKKREAKPYEDSYGHQFKDLPPVPPQTPSGIIEFIRSTFGLGNVTDGSVILYLNFTFVVASLVLYAIVRALSSGSDTDVLDRQAYFNLVTKHKELQLQLQQKNAEIQNLHAVGLQQQQQQQQMQQIPDREPELLALRQQVDGIQRELQTSQMRCQEAEVQYNQLCELAQQKATHITDLTAKLNELVDREKESQEVARQFDSVRAELEAVRGQLQHAQNSAVTLQQELEQQQQDHELTRQAVHDQTSEAQGLLSRISQLEQTKDALEIELGDLKTENAGLLVTIQQLEMDKSNNEGGSAAESGGSGWSDFGGDDVVDDLKDVKDEKTPDASNSELADLRARYKQHEETIEELNTLKAKLEEVEQELIHYKKLSEKQGKGKNENDLRLQNASADVAAAKKQAEEAALKKTELEDQLKETLKMLSNSMNRGTECDKIIDSLKEKIEALKEEKSENEKKLLEVDVVLQKKQLEMDSLIQKKQLELDTVIQEKDDKIRSLEAECKKLITQYSKLETKSFHDVMKYKKQLDDYETTKMLGSQGIGALGTRDVFNAPDLRPGSGRQVGSPLGAQGIWDEPESMAPTLPTLQQDDYFSSGSMTMPKRRSSRRSDHRLLAGIGGEQSPSDREDKSKSKKDGVHRRRSRSHGRPMPAFNADPYAMGAYLPGSSDSSFMSQQAPGFHPLSGRHSKSGHLHYSSGGSNGARSPPPGMPVLGDIPPPGTRKPITKRLGPGYLGK